MTNGEDVRGDVSHCNDEQVRLAHRDTPHPVRKDWRALVKVRPTHSIRVFGYKFVHRNHFAWGFVLLVTVSEEGLREVLLQVDDQTVQGRGIENLTPPV